MFNIFIVRCYHFDSKNKNIELDWGLRFYQCLLPVMFKADWGLRFYQCLLPVIFKADWGLRFLSMSVTCDV